MRGRLTRRAAGVAAVVAAVPLAAACRAKPAAAPAPPASAAHAEQTGRVVVRYRAEVLGLPPVGSPAYREAGRADSAGRALRSRVASYTSPELAGLVEVSPALLTARITVADPSRADALLARLRRDPAVATAEHEVVTETRDPAPATPRRP